MNTMFKPLEGDDNVILLDNDTFTVSRLKDLLKQQINKRFIENYTIFSISFFTLPIGNEVKVELNDIQLCNLSRDCKLLKVGSKGWQKGKLRIQVDIATAKAVRTIDAGHAPSHRVDPQTARVACESDF